MGTKYLNYIFSVVVGGDYIWAWAQFNVGLGLIWECGGAWVKVLLELQLRGGLLGLGSAKAYGWFGSELWLGIGYG